jgi:hypothetical protein
MLFPRRNEINNSLRLTPTYHLDATITQHLAGSPLVRRSARLILGAGVVHANPVLAILFLCFRSA